MGLDVHDVSAKPILSFCTDEEQPTIKHSEKSLLRPTFEFVAPCTSNAALLEPGIVITVEPGICMFEDGQVTA